MGNEKQSKSHFLFISYKKENQYKQSTVTFIYKLMKIHGLNVFLSLNSHILEVACDNFL